MVVGRRTSSLYLGQDAPLIVEAIEEVGPCLGDQAVLGREDHLFLKAELVPQQGREVILDRPAAGAVDVASRDLVRRGIDMPIQCGGEVIDVLKLGNSVGVEIALGPALVFSHELQLGHQRGVS